MPRHTSGCYHCFTADGKKLISVEQIRQMRADAFVKPSEGKRKIYIIDGVQLMNDAGSERTSDRFGAAAVFCRFYSFK